MSNPSEEPRESPAGPDGAAPGPRPRFHPILLVVPGEDTPERAFPGAAGEGAPGILTTRWERLPADPESAGDPAGLVFQLPDPRPGRIGVALSGWRGRSAVPLLSFSLTRHQPAERQAATLGVDAHLRCPFPLQGLVAILEREGDRIQLRRRLETFRVRLRRERELVAILREVAAAANSELDPDRTIAAVVDRIRTVLPFQAWTLYLVREGHNQLVRRSGAGEGKAVRIGESIPTWVVRHQEPLVLTCGEGRVREFPTWDGVVGPAVQSVLCVPLRSRGRIIGALQLVNRQGGGRFSGAARDLLTGLMEPASIAIENALLFRKAEELSTTDDLTQLHNSRYLNQYLQREVERSRRYNLEVSLIFLDLDGFKNVNDRHGHLAGSRALVEVGEVLRRTVRAIDVVSRFGGDEFTVILPQTGVEGAATIAERIRARIEAAVFLQDLGLKVRITASLGVATFPDHGHDKDDLIAEADRAMYVVKARNKNAVEVAARAGPGGGGVERAGSLGI
ncbi:MAG: diguanylate cyclase [Acidobacteria bacterium]|nr:diguanylate cyclase [Acidobacteriota bacterium]